MRSHSLIILRRSLIFPSVSSGLTDNPCMRTIYLILSFLVCVALCISGQSGAKQSDGNSFRIRKVTPTFHIIKIPGTDQYQLLSGQVRREKLIVNLVSTKEVVSESRKLASVGSGEENAISYQLEVVKQNIKSFTKRDLNNSSLQIQFVAP